MEHFVHFLSRERKRNQKKTPIKRDPAGCPVLLEKGALSATRYRSNSTSPQAKIGRPFLRCSARLKGKVKTEMNFSLL